MGIIDPALFKLGLSRRIAVIAPHMLAVPAMVATSDLIATIPDRLAQAARQTSPIAIWKPPLDLPLSVIRMAWHERTHHDPAARWFRERVLEAGRISPVARISSPGPRESSPLSRSAKRRSAT